MKAAIISALSSGQGKTLFTMALLHWFKKQEDCIQSFKTGPDYIDTMFHEKITGKKAVNLDLFMNNQEEVKNTFNYYASSFKNTIIEGAMGFYDGLETGTSTYNIAKILNIPTILIISGEGSYSTLVAIIKGILEYRKSNNIKAVILNRISSSHHYKLIKDQIEDELPHLKVAGWIEKDLQSINSRHLGLDTTELTSLDFDIISESVMQHIDIPLLLNIMDINTPIQNDMWNTYINAAYQKKTLTIVQDSAFSFTYVQNIDFFNKIFNKVHTISALEDNEIPKDTNIVYIPGGYIETPENADLLNNANAFKRSLKCFSTNTNNKIYAECAGLMMLGNSIKLKNNNIINGAGILDINFEMCNKRQRLGYYKSFDSKTAHIYKGHAFHYSQVVNVNNNVKPLFYLFKNSSNNATCGGWQNNTSNVTATYLHSMFYNQPELISNYF